MTSSTTPSLSMAFFLSLIESLVNTALRLDPETQTQLSSLNNKSICIELSKKSYLISIQNNKISLASYNQEKYDSQIVTSLSALIDFALDQKASLVRADIEITGNTELVHQLFDLIKQLHIDWEEELSHYIGDIASHQIGNFARGLKNFLFRAKDTFSENLNEYLTEEARQIPSRYELHDFLSKIDILRADTDKLTARIERLQKNYSMRAA